MSKQQGKKQSDKKAETYGNGYSLQLEYSLPRGRKSDPDPSSHQARTQQSPVDLAC